MRAVAPVAALVAALAAGCSASTGDHPHAAATTGSSAGAAASSSPSSTGPTSQVPGAWRVHATVASWQLPEAVSRAVVIPQGGVGLLAGGLLEGDVSSAATYRIDPASGRSTRLGDLAQAAHDSAGALVAGRPTLVGGGGAHELDAVQAQAPDGRWSVVGHLPQARSDLSVLGDGAGARVIGGYDGVRTPRSVLTTADGHTFGRGGALARGTRYAVAVSVGGTTWVLGGEVAGREVDEVQRLDPGAARARVVARLPMPLGHAAAAVVDGQVLIIGGRTAPHTPTDRMWSFDPKRLRFRSQGRLPYAVADAGVRVAGGVAYVLGGETPSFTARVTEVRIVPGSNESPRNGQ